MLVFVKGSAESISSVDLQAQDQRADRADRGRASTPLRRAGRGMASLDQVTVPAQDRVRSYRQQELAEPLSGEAVEQAGEHHAIRVGERQFADGDGSLRVGGWYRPPMTRSPLWRSLLVAVAYVVGTLAVLLLGGALMTARSPLFHGHGKVVLLLGAAVLLLGVVQLVYRAVRSMTRYRGH
jgi:hypothetical protein